MRRTRQVTSRTRQVARPLWREQRGVALPLTLMALLVLAVMSLALLSIGASEVQIAANHLQATQALFTAEAGVERAIADFVAEPNKVTDAVSGSKVTLYTKAPLQSAGSYSVTYTGVGFATVQIESTGYTTWGGGNRTVQALVTTHFVPDQALLGDKRVTVRGKSRVEGELGNIHSNLQTNVTPCRTGICVKGTATSSGSRRDYCRGCQDPNKVGNAAASGRKPPVTVPEEVTATSIRDDAIQAGRTVYVLQDDGTIQKWKSGGPQEVYDTNAAPWYGWQLNEQRLQWNLTSDTPLDGVYYASKDIKIYGNPGTPTTPWQATLLSGADATKGKINIKGAPVMVPEFRGLLMVSSWINIRFEESDDSEDSPNDVELKGTIFATSYSRRNDKDKDYDGEIDDYNRGSVWLGKGVGLNGNVVAHGKITVKNNASVTFNSSDIAYNFNPKGSLQVLPGGTVAY